MFNGLGLVGLVVVPLAEPAALPLADPAALPPVDPPDGDVVDPPIAPPVELPVAPPVDPPMLLPLVPPVEPPMPLPVDPLVEPPILPVEPLVDPPRLLPVPAEPLVLLPGDTELDEPLPSVPLSVVPLEPPTFFFACPGGTPVRDAAFSLLPGVRPPSRAAALPLLPGERWCIVSVSWRCVALPLDISCDPIDPLDMPEPLEPPDILDPLLAANVRPETPSAAAIATANVVFLISKPPNVGLWN